MSEPKILQQLDNIGDLTQLNTTNKTNLVSSHNEINNNFNTHLKDNIDHVYYAVTTGTANTYAVTLNPAPTSYVDGMAIAIKINIASTGASTLNVNGLGAKQILDSLGNAITSGGLKAGIIYSMRYNSTTGNFIVQGKGGGGNATVSQILNGYTATTDTGQITGTMPDKSKTGDDFISSSYPTLPISKGANVQYGTFGTASPALRLAICPPTGWYPGGGGGYVTAEASEVASAIGLTADKLLSGNTVCNVTGNIIPFANGLVAGTTQYLIDPTYYSTTSNTFVKLGKRYTTNYSGSIRFEFQCFQTSVQGYFKVYKNGAPFGTQRRNTDGVWTTFSEDYSCNPGDYFELYAESGTVNTSYPAAVQNTVIKLGNMSTPAVSMT